MTTLRKILRWIFFVIAFAWVLLLALWVISNRLTDWRAWIVFWVLACAAAEIYELRFKKGTQCRQ